MDLPDLKTDPKYGYFPRWPKDGDGWLHPEDVALVRTLIPSDRVFCRDGETGPFGVFHYGPLRFRAKPALWQDVPPPDFQIGDWVEVLTRGQLNEPRTGVVRETRWDEETAACRYQLEEAGQPIPNFYGAEDLRRVEPPQPREEMRIEPRGDDELPVED